MAKPSGNYTPLGGFISKAENPRCLDLFATKQVDGYPAKFMRFVGPENFVIEVNGAERTVTRDFWRNLPHLDASKVGASNLDRLG
jgi:hypothetical protein